MRGFAGVGGWGVTVRWSDAGRNIICLWTVAFTIQNTRRSLTSPSSPPSYAMASLFGAASHLLPSATIASTSASSTARLPLSSSSSSLKCIRSSPLLPHIFRYQVRCSSPFVMFFYIFSFRKQFVFSCRSDRWLERRLVEDSVHWPRRNALLLMLISWKVQERTSESCWRPPSVILFW